MKTIIRTILLVLCGTSVLSAAEPPRVVVLDNENLMEGAVTREGDRYVIRTDTSELSLPFKRVLAVVNNKQEAFNVVAERANRRDADERLRLARWCVANGLLDLALSEAKTASQMRPGFAAAEQFVRATEAIKALPRTETTKTDTLAKSETLEDVPTIDYNSESFPLFAARVNAILVNLCATCHAGEKTKFRLVRTSGRAGVGKNLMAALGQINTKEPLSSPLLTKAVTPHGTALEAPMKTRNHPAYAALETWVRFARAAEGTQEPEPLPAPAPVVVSAEPQKLPTLDDPKLPKVESPKNDTIKIEVPPATPTTPTPSSFGADSKTPPPTTTEKTNNADPFDPGAFNNQRPKPGK